MPTHADMAARLLNEAAGFFRTVGEQNEPLKAQMDQNADMYEQAAMLVSQDPGGEVDFGGDNDDVPPAA